jgi:hypothetical protein
MLGDASLLELTECTAVPRGVDSPSTPPPRSTDGALLEVRVVCLDLLVHAVTDVALEFVSVVSERPISTAEVSIWPPREHLTREMDISEKSLQRPRYIPAAMSVKREK